MSAFIFYVVAAPGWLSFCGLIFVTFLVSVFLWDSLFLRCGFACLCCFWCLPVHFSCAWLVCGPVHGSCFMLIMSTLLVFATMYLVALWCPDDVLSLLLFCRLFLSSVFGHFWLSCYDQGYIIDVVFHNGIGPFLAWFMCALIALCRSRPRR